MGAEDDILSMGTCRIISIDQVEAAMGSDENRNELQSYEMATYKAQIVRIECERINGRVGMYGAADFWNMGLIGGSLAMEDLGNRVWLATVYLCGN